MRSLYTSLNSPARKYVLPTIFGPREFKPLTQALVGKDIVLDYNVANVTKRKFTLNVNSQIEHILTTANNLDNINVKIEEQCNPIVISKVPGNANHFIHSIEFIKILSSESATRPAVWRLERDGEAAGLTPPFQPSPQALPVAGLLSVAVVVTPQPLRGGRGRPHLLFHGAAFPGLRQGGSREVPPRGAGHGAAVRRQV